MRSVIAALAGCLVLTSCVTSNPATAAGTQAGNSKRITTPVVRSDDQVSGNVVSVNPLLRFVVMDFSVRTMPALEQRLNVYHGGRKVGEVKVTGPMRDTTIAGDIVAGEVQIGDEVRQD